jgi:uncharacterized protein (DUF362 family)
MKVAALRVGGGYPTEVPFSPNVAFPEYPFAETSEQGNEVYVGVRDALRLLGLDAERFGTAAWNPLRGIIKKGETVFVKPNWVDHKHRKDETIWSVITHSSVVRALCDYVILALEGEGRIIVGDNPHVDTDFSKLCQRTQIMEVADFYRRTCPGITFEVQDLRLWRTEDIRYYGFKSKRTTLPGDPQGHSILDLGAKSLLKDRPWWLFRGTYSKRWETLGFHHGNTHQYSFANSILNADVFISVPKLKSHCKVGATLNVKGLIGTVANKNCLVHWSIGFPALGGDEYPAPAHAVDYAKLYLQHLYNDLVPESLQILIGDTVGRARMVRAFADWLSIGDQRLRILRGAWKGNDTIWRMTVDVFNAFAHDWCNYLANRGRARRTFSIVDGIEGGDVDGPHFPRPVKPGVLLAGENLLAVDVVGARIMDYRIDEIAYLRHLLAQERIEPNSIQIKSEAWEEKGFFDESRKYLGYAPPHRWPGLSLHGIAPDS